MHITHRQEAFSMAYVRAVVAAAGFRLLGGTKPDDDSVDLTIASRGAGGTIRSPKLDIQLKSKLGRPPNEPTWPFDLKAKNYDDLRYPSFQVPRILVVVAIPEVHSDWLEQDDECLIMRHCGWWVSLRGREKSENAYSVRVQIPRMQRFDREGLAGIMERLSEGGMP